MHKMKISKKKVLKSKKFDFQLILKTKTTYPLSIHYFMLKGPFADMKVSTKIYKHDFTDAVRFDVV
jgi:Zn-dependent M32 family carboxypeptidase